MTTLVRGSKRFGTWGLIFVQVALIATWVVEPTGGVERSHGALVRLETGGPAGAPLTIESGLQGALRRARSWSEDAYLMSVALQVDWPSDPAAASGSEIPGAGWVIYTFASGERGVGLDGEAATLSMMVDRTSGVVIDEREMGWTWRPGRGVDIATYPISSTVALFAVETTQGQAYRMACPQFRHLSRVSVVPPSGGGNAYWLVTYEDQRFGGRPEIVVRVDAMTGDIQRQEAVAGGGQC